MSLRRLLNCVHGLLLDGCSTEEERDAMELSLLVPPEQEPQMSFEARVRAAGGEVG